MSEGRLETTSKKNRRLNINATPFVSKHIKERELPETNMEVSEKEKRDLSTIIDDTRNTVMKVITNVLPKKEGGKRKQRRKTRKRKRKTNKRKTMKKKIRRVMKKKRTLKK